MTKNNITSVLMIAVIATGLFSVSVAQADDVTIGFEDSSQSYGDFQSYTENGFVLTNNNYAPGSYAATIVSASDYSITGNSSAQFYGICGSNGSNAYGSPCSSTPISVTLAKVGGGAFSLKALDAANLLTEADNGFVTLTGHLQGGGTIIDTVSTGNTWNTFSLAGLTNVTSIDLSVSGSIYGAVLDNVRVDTAPVPIPPVIYMFASGLMGLVGMRRKIFRA